MIEWNNLGFPKLGVSQFEKSNFFYFFVIWFPPHCTPAIASLLSVSQGHLLARTHREPVWSAPLPPYIALIPLACPNVVLLSQLLPHPCVGSADGECSSPQGLKVCFLEKSSFPWLFGFSPKAFYIDLALWLPPRPQYLPNLFPLAKSLFW